MRIVITGATGNVGTSTVRALPADPAVTSPLCLARRTPDWRAPKAGRAVREFLASRRP